MENIVVIGILCAGVGLMFIVTKVTKINILDELTRPTETKPEEKEDMV
jgi:hypothetical protein